MNNAGDERSIAEKYAVSSVRTLNALESDEFHLLSGMLIEAKSYICGFNWCRKLKKAYFGCGIGGIFSIFLMDIDNASSPSDNLLWVIVGDIPPAYLVADDGPQNPREVLAEYISLMREWVFAVENSKGIDDLIPVNVEPTLDNAMKLKGRLDYLQSEFL